MTDSSSPSDRLNPSTPTLHVYVCTISINYNYLYANGFLLLFSFRRCIPASLFRSGSSRCCQQLWWRVSPEALHLLPMGLFRTLLPSASLLLPQVAVGNLGARPYEHHCLWTEHWIEDWRREEPEEGHFDWLLDSSLECKFVKITNQSNKIIIIFEKKNVILMICMNVFF